MADLYFANAMKIITVATLKGGNAKTTTSLAIAAGLAEKGHAVALLDADPQSTATMVLGLKPVAEPWAAEPVELFIKGLSAGSITLIRGGRPLRLATAAQRAAFFDCSDLRIGFAVVDTAPGEVELVDAALRCSDLVVVPVEPSPLSLTGLCDVAGLASRHEPSPVVRSVLTRAHRIRVSTRELAVRVERLVPGSLCRTMIPEDVRVVDSPDAGLPVTLSHPRCRASQAYRELVDELYPLLAGFDRAATHPEPTAPAPAMASAYGR
ncbi:MAG: ParA family protein [Longimicrobiales bacterium]